MSPQITKRRLFGIDRAGPPPPQAGSDQPLRPWTLPNAIDYLRLAGIPVFLILALGSAHGHSTAAVGLFAVIGWTDYLDGFTARLTGQYSRLGVLLDPVIDRLLIVSGFVVAYDFALLPRWAIVLAMTREVFMLVISRHGLSRGIAIRINWFGRLGVAPTMGAPFFAMAGVHWLALIMLYCGLALTLIATGLYMRDGARQLRNLGSETGEGPGVSSSA